MERNSLQIIVYLKGFSGTGQPCLHTSRTKNIEQWKRSRTPDVSFPSRETFSPQRQQTWILIYKPVHSRQPNKKTTLKTSAEIPQQHLFICPQAQHQEQRQQFPDLREPWTQAAFR